VTCITYSTSSTVALAVISAEQIQTTEAGADRLALAVVADAVELDLPEVVVAVPDHGAGLFLMLCQEILMRCK
jgi:hypothetical protein